MKFRAFVRFLKPKIDRDAGVIPGVAVVTMGPAEGHGILVDAKTLETVLAAAQKYETGVKVKWNPETNNHGDGGIVGLMPKDSFRIDNDVLRADLQVRKSYPHREALFELADEQGDTFGLSMDFDCVEEDDGNGVKYARCTDIFAATVVDQPAANPNGLWSIEPKQTTSTKPMAFSKEDKEELGKLIGEAVRPISEGLSAVTKNVEGLQKGFKALREETAPIDLAAVPEDEKLAAGVEDEDEEETKMRKLRAFRADASKVPTAGSIAKMVTAAVGKAFAGFSKESGGQAASGSAKGGKGNGEDDKEHAFIKKVRLQKAAGAKRLGLAIRQAAQNNPAEYEDYTAKVGRGECKPVEDVIGKD